MTDQQPPETQPCTGPGDTVEITTDDGVHRETWHGCPTCHGSH